MWLSREDSPEPGKYHLDRAPYQSGPLEAISDPLTKRITLIWASQLGKTLILKITIGYFIDQEPSSILYIMPTLSLARTFSKRRIGPMLRDVDALKGKVKEPRAKDSTNNTLEKTFPGGVLTLIGSNAAASLSSNPIRIVFGDERDKWPFSAGDAGDPFALAEQRTQNYENRKVIDVGTPGIKDISPLEHSWERSDQRHCHLPCPKCKTFQHLQFGQLKWEKDKDGRAVNVYYECKECKAKLTEADKLKMLSQGKWIADRPDRDHIGFHLNALYSPWLTWQEFAQSWLEAKASNNPEILKQFINEKLAEWWDDKSIATVSDDVLLKRLEGYSGIPKGALLLTAAVDVQDNRIEVLVLGWGPGEEKWHINHVIVPYKPSSKLAWDEVDKELVKTYRHESGIDMNIACVCVDTAGHFTQQAYDFCKRRQMRRVFAIIGRSGAGKPIIDKPTTKNKARVLLFTVGTDTAKELIYAHLTTERVENQEVNPGYIHFRTGEGGCDEEYFKQLTAEKLVTKWSRGKSTRAWVQVRPRNEILDLFVYNYAAFRLLDADMEKLGANIQKKIERHKEEPEKQEEKPAQKKTKGRRRSGWATMGGFLGRKT
jgi:phage terminase large subunit GpA-like protein